VGGFPKHARRHLQDHLMMHVLLVLHEHVRTHTHTHHTHTHTQAHTHLFYTCSHTCTHTCTHACAYTHARTHSHKHPPPCATARAGQHHPRIWVHPAVHGVQLSGLFQGACIKSAQHDNFLCRLCIAHVLLACIICALLQHPFACQLMHAFVPTQ